MSASSGKVEGYTPGPWKVGRKIPRLVCGPDDEAICECDGSVDGMRWATENANAARIVYAVNNIDAREQTIATQAARIAGLEADAIKSRQRLEWFAKAMSEDHEYVPYFDTDANCWGYPYLVSNAGGFGGGVGFAGFDTLEQAIDSAMERAALEGSKPE